MNGISWPNPWDLQYRHRLADFELLELTATVIVVRYLEVKGYVEFTARHSMTREELFRWLESQLVSWGARLLADKAETTEHGWLERVRKSQKEPEAI